MTAPQRVTAKTHDAVVAALARPPARHSVAQLAEFTGKSTQTIGSVLGVLLDTGAAVYLGRASDGGISELHGRTKMYGPRGATPFKAEPVAAVAIPFRELRRDPFEHVKLAMETRR